MGTMTQISGMEGLYSNQLEVAVTTDSVFNLSTATATAAGEFIQLLQAVSPQGLSHINSADQLRSSPGNEQLVIQPNSAEQDLNSSQLSPFSQQEQLHDLNNNQLSPFSKRLLEDSVNLSPFNHQQQLQDLNNLPQSSFSQQQQLKSPTRRIHLTSPLKQITSFKQSPTSSQLSPQVVQQQEVGWSAAWGDLSDFSCGTLMEGILTEEVNGRGFGDVSDVQTLEDQTLICAKRVKYGNDFNRSLSNDNMITSSPCTSSTPGSADYKQHFVIRQRSNNSLSSSLSSSSSSSCLSQPEQQQQREDPTQQQKFCLVCGDVASGLHYGASSCEACKAFFKRTVQGNVEYVCQAGGKCLMTKRGRKACQACRYNKCVRIGMLREGIRADRQRGGQHKHRMTHFSPLSSPPPGGRIVKLEGAASPSSKSNDDRLLTCLLSIEPQKLFVRSDASLENGNAKLTTALLDLADKELVAMICWAKQIPGFSEIAIENQVSLFHYAWLDLMCLSVAYRSSPYNGILRFADDCNLAEPSRSDGSPDSGKTHSHVGLPPQLDTALRSLARRLTELNVQYEEFVLLKSLVLMHADMELAEDVPSVRRLRDALYDSLLSYELSRGDSDYHRRIGRLLLVLPLVVRSRLRLSDYWHAVKQSGRKIPQRLLSEMIDFSCSIATKGCGNGDGCCLNNGLRNVGEASPARGKGADAWGSRGGENGEEKFGCGGVGKRDKEMFDSGMILCSDN